MPRIAIDAAPDLNTTPLIDVMLVLLVLMIITLPAMTHATKLAVSSDQALTERPAIVAIDYDGQISAEGQAMRSPDELRKWAAAMRRSQPSRFVQVNADRRARYEFVAVSLAALQRGGVQRLGVSSIAD